MLVPDIKKISRLYICRGADLKDRMNRICVDSADNFCDVIRRYQISDAESNDRIWVEVEFHWRISTNTNVDSRTRIHLKKKVSSLRVGVTMLWLSNYGHCMTVQHSNLKILFWVVFIKEPGFQTIVTHPINNLH